MDLFAPRPTSLIKWALSRPDTSALSPTVATDPGVLVLARGLGVLGLYASRWNIAWTAEPPYDSIPELTDTRFAEMNARTRSALLARVAILESGGKDDTHTGRLLHDRANFSRLLARPNSAPAGVRAALSAAVAEDMMSVTVKEVVDVKGIQWGAIGAWLTNQILVGMMDPNWGEDEPLDLNKLEYDCDQCREDAYTPWELVWKYYSKPDLAAHIKSYHAPMAQAKRYLESLKSATPGGLRPGVGVGYACPGWDYSNPSNVRRCDLTYATHEALADHVLRAHFDDVGAELPARYLVAFAEVAASKVKKEGVEREVAERPQTPPQTPKVTPKSTPKSTPKATPKATPKRTSKALSTSSATRTATLLEAMSLNDHHGTGTTTADDKHAETMALWLPQIRKWAAAEERHNNSEQRRRFLEFMERHPPSEDLWNSLDEKLLVV